MRWIIGLIIFLLIPCSLFGTVYYVSDQGSNGDNGLTVTTAWLTIDYAVSNATSPGDSILVFTGDEFKETVTMDASGTFGNLITVTMVDSATGLIGANAVGAKPIINGADVIDTWVNLSGAAGWGAGVTFASTGSAADFNFRMIVPASTLASDGTEVQIEIIGHPSVSTVFVDCYIGEVASVGDAYDMEVGTITQITFGDTAGFTIAAGNSITSDFVTYSFDSSKAYIISVGSTGGHYGDGGFGTAYYDGTESDQAGVADQEGMDLANRYYFLDSLSIQTSSNEYYHLGMSTEPIMAWIGGTKGVKMGSSELVIAQDQWAYTTEGDDTLTIYTTTAADTNDIEVGQRALGIDINAQSYIAIEYMKIKRANGDGIQQEGDGDNVISISYVDVENSGNNGMFFDETDSLIIEYCNVDTSINNALALWGSAANALSNTIVRYCSLTVVDQNDGISLHKDAGLNNAGDNHLFSNNYTSGCSEEGIDITTGSNIIIEFNESNGDTAAGIVLDNAIITGTIVRFNWIRNSQDDGLKIANAQSPLIYYNRIENSAAYSVDITGNSDQVKLYNNIFYQTSSSLHLRIGGADVDTVEAKNNIFYQADEGQNFIGFSGGAEITNVPMFFDYNQYYRTDDDDTQSLWAGVDFSDWQDSTMDASGAFGDPLFTNVGTDFNLENSSPCIDAGTDVDLTSDYAGNPVPVHSIEDMGAYEFQEVYPSTQATSITFSNVETTTLTVGWTRGDGDSVLVVVKSGSGPTNPTDHTVYTANSVFGSGEDVGSSSYASYNAQGTSLNITGLTAETTYYFEVSEYDTTGPGFQSYLINPLSGNQASGSSDEGFRAVSDMLEIFDQMGRF